MIVLATTSILADVIRGGDLIIDWGTGQTVMLIAGLALGIAGWLVHRKAMRDEKNAVRRYHRTVVFLIVPFVLMIAMPVAAAELIARLLPVSVVSPNAYQQPDEALGFSLQPNRKYRIASRAKDFDIRVSIDDQGFRYDDSNGPPSSISDADVLILGDSHAFGFGIEQDQTLSAKLTRFLNEQKHPSRVVNGGVPGYGIGQMVLRMRQQDRLKAGAVVVLWINPVNDLVNLSSSIDYHFPKPHAEWTNDQLAFQPAPSLTLGQAFLFSEPFDRINDFFQLNEHPGLNASYLYRRITRTRPLQQAAKDGFIQLEDQTDAEQFALDDKKRIAESPLLYASRYWPQMPIFAEERTDLTNLCGAVLAEADRLAKANRWHLLALVAPEGFQHQQYAKAFARDVIETASQRLGQRLVMEPGWSREMVLESLAKNQIPTIAPDYAGMADVDRRFLKNDDHTSAIGHAEFAESIGRRLIENGWLPSPDQR